jgi:hypothetical protein
MEYVFDPQVYKGTLLRNRCMGDELDSIPIRGQVARPIEDISQALYKTEDNY